MMIERIMRRIAEVNVGFLSLRKSFDSCLSHCCTSAASRSNARCNGL
jgi:hypothetical protein